MATEHTPTRGPNVNRLISERLAVEAVPPGGGIGDALQSLLDPALLREQMRRAIDWVNAALAVYKTAPDNQFGDDDEAIAGEMLRALKAAKARARLDP